jgi:hypothetical protein
MELQRGEENSRGALQPTKNNRSSDFRTQMFSDSTKNEQKLTCILPIPSPRNRNRNRNRNSQRVIKAKPLTLTK